MQITGRPSDRRQGPPEWFAGTAWLEEIAVPAALSRLRVHSVCFMPGISTGWHADHPD